MAYSVAFEAASSLPGHAPASGSAGLDAEELRILSAILDVLSGGKSAAAITESVDQKLRGPMSRLAPAFHHGLAAVDGASRAKTGTGLTELDARERRRFVMELRSGHKLTAFFGLLTGTCTCAATANPRHSS